MEHIPSMQMPYGSPKQQMVMNPEHHKKEMHGMCNKYHYHFVQIETVDGVYDGIIDGVDGDHVYLLVPSGEIEGEEHYGHEYRPDGYPYGSPFGFGYPRRFRRFGRFSFPFFAIRRLFFPFFF